MLIRWLTFKAAAGFHSYMPKNIAIDEFFLS